jgi:hypothetical protein
MRPWGYKRSSIWESENADRRPGPKAPLSQSRCVLERRFSKEIVEWIDWVSS